MNDTDSAIGNAWLPHARAAANAPSLRPREPLYIDVDAHSVLVGSIERETAERMIAAALPLRPVSLPLGELIGESPLAAMTGSWQVDAPASSSLAAIAAWLHDAGLAGPWRDELLAVVDDEEHAVAQVERGVVRVLGLTTFAVHLVGYSFDGRRVWVQQRAFDKATDPGKWDTLMGGQVAAGETTESALARETWEEAGLAIATLLELRRRERLAFRRPVAEGFLVEYIDVFTARLPEGIEPCNRDGEVERFASLDAANLEAWLARGEFTLEAALIFAGQGSG